MNETTTSATETVAPPSQENVLRSETLSGFAVEKTTSTARIAVVIITDASLFLIWIAVAWPAQYVATIASENGVNENFANAFMWISSASTLIMTLLYIASDIKKEFIRLFKNGDKR